MKRLGLTLLSSLILLGINGCQTFTNPTDPSKISSYRVDKKDTVYPFDNQKDFFPLYNTSSWNYEVYDQEKKLVTTLTKTLDVQNENSLDFDKKNNYYIVSLKKNYANQQIKDREPFEYLRRRENQIAYGKYDQLGLYLDKKNDSNAYDPYKFRAFVDFQKAKTEKITVKAGTFDCLKAEFAIAPLDKYTIWYAKGIGEVKRIVDSSGFRSYTYELSSYNLSAQFMLRREYLTNDRLPENILKLADEVKSNYLTLNELPKDLFERKSNNTIFVEKNIAIDNYKKVYELSFINRSLVSKDNINLTLVLNVADNAIQNLSVTGQNKAKPIYNGKIVDKLPTIIR